MKKVILFSLVIISIFACRKVVKEESNPVVETPQEVVGDSTEQDLKESADKIAVVKSGKQSDIQSTKKLKESLKANGFQLFDYVDEKTKDTILMQQYFIVFLKKGPMRSQSEEEAAQLQKKHLAHLGKMYDLGYADISGPFGDNGDIRGITIYNVPTQKMADSLANADPMVKAGRLVIEVHPWWAAKGFSLR
ncbi:YciI family protein [Mariniflexile aquimaris]|uniref:YciI family protein n=1 Tax=Mariniflexile aquimaris TaxID=881009 RepID=A0ABW3BQT2_9FLAO